MFLPDIMTLSLTPPLPELSSVSQLQLQSSLLSVSVHSYHFFSIGAELQLHNDILLSPFSRPELLPTNTSHLRLPHCRSLSCAPVFLVFFFVCFFFLSLSPPSRVVSRHVKTCPGEQGGGGEGTTHGAVSYSTADRWEGLPGVKVQSQGNTTPPALASGDFSRFTLLHAAGFSNLSRDTSTDLTDSEYFNHHDDTKQTVHSRAEEFVTLCDFMGKANMEADTCVCQVMHQIAKMKPTETDVESCVKS